MSNELETEAHDGVLVVRFTRPEVRNPLSVSVLGQIEDVLAECVQSKNVRGLIFTGTADVFASGANLREIDALTQNNVPDFARRGQRLMFSIEALSQVTVAAVNGYCFGGALDLALACDRRIASSHAKFAHPGAGLGIITGWGGTQRLPRLVGQANACEMFFTAGAISADRALAIGLVDEVVSDPVENAIKWVLR